MLKSYILTYLHILNTVVTDSVDYSLFSVSLLKNACGNKRQQCENNGICQAGFTDKGHRCLCSPGFRGEHCEKGTRQNSQLLNNF